MFQHCWSRHARARSQTPSWLAPSGLPRRPGSTRRQRPTCCRPETPRRPDQGGRQPRSAVERQLVRRNGAGRAPELPGLPHIERGHSGEAQLANAFPDAGSSLLEGRDHLGSGQPPPVLVPCTQRPGVALPLHPPVARLQCQRLFGHLSDPCPSRCGCGGVHVMEKMITGYGKRAARPRPQLATSHCLGSRSGTGTERSRGDGGVSRCQAEPACP